MLILTFAIAAAALASEPVSERGVDLPTASPPAQFACGGCVQGWDIYGYYHFFWYGAEGCILGDLCVTCSPEWCHTNKVAEYCSGPHSWCQPAQRAWLGRVNWGSGTTSRLGSPGRWLRQWCALID